MRTPKDQTRELTRASLDVLAKHAQSFRWASLFLPAPARRDIAVLYAFCRRMDDMVDESASRIEAEEGLRLIEIDLSREAPLDPLVTRFREIAFVHGFGLGPATDLIAGLRSDLGDVRVRSWEELELYSYRVAGTVGLMMAPLLGAKRPDAQRYAVSLGVAMQLTNICRDVAEDLRRARVYLPTEELLRHNYDPGELTGNGREGRAQVEGLAEAVRVILTRAEDLYTFASRGFHMIPRRGRLAVLVAALLYREIGRKLIGQQEGNPLLGRTVIGPFRKLSLLGEAVLRLLFSRPILSKRTFALSPIEAGPEALYTNPSPRLPLS